MIRTPTPPEQSDIQVMAQSQVEHGVESNSGMYTTPCIRGCLDFMQI